MIRRVVAALICCGSFSLAGTSYDDARWTTADAATADAGTVNAGTASDNADAVNVATTDIGDVVAALVSAKAGRSVTRISAGLSGDWHETSDNFFQPIPANSAPRRPPPAIAPAEPAASDATTTQAVALPLPPALLSCIPGLILAYLARRRFAGS